MPAMLVVFQYIQYCRGNIEKFILLLRILNGIKLSNQLKEKADIREFHVIGGCFQVLFSSTFFFKVNESILQF